MLAVLISAFAPFLGIVGSLLPNIVNLFVRKQELNHDLELEKLRISDKNRDREVELIKTAVAEGDSLRAHDSSLDGGLFLNALRASIRPVVTYSFFILFVTIKIAAAYVMLAGGADVPTMLIAVWDPDTSALFSTIVAFWFGSRIFEKR